MHSRLLSLLEQQRKFQANTLSLIASESIPWPSVRYAEQSTLLSAKYAEGYPGKRYYAGCEIFDEIEQLAIDSCKKLFNCNYANVQPLSGSNANLAVYLALLKPGDAILGMALKSGGHLTHGSTVSLTGKWFESHTYELDENCQIDYAKLQTLACAIKPKIIIAGCSSYPRALDMQKFRAIADACGAYLLADIAHVAGLIAGGVYDNPFPHAHIVTSTTHKTLRGPRGGLIMTNDELLAKKINSAVFPGLQGGPFPHVIAGKAAAFLEDYTDYSRSVLRNTQALSKGIKEYNVPFIADFDNLATDTHILLLDVLKFGGGNKIEKLLSDIGIICNKNIIPHDTQGPRDPSGVRLGGTVITNRGFSEIDAHALGSLIGRAIQDQSDLQSLRNHVQLLCEKYPLEY